MTHQQGRCPRPLDQEVGLGRGGLAHGRPSLGPAARAEAGGEPARPDATRVRGAGTRHATVEDARWPPAATPRAGICRPAAASVSPASAPRAGPRTELSAEGSEASNRSGPLGLAGLERRAPASNPAGRAALVPGPLWGGAVLLLPEAGSGLDSPGVRCPQAASGAGGNTARETGGNAPPAALGSHPAGPPVRGPPPGRTPRPRPAVLSVPEPAAPWNSLGAGRRAARPAPAPSDGARARPRPSASSPNSRSQGSGRPTRQVSGAHPAAVAFRPTASSAIWPSAAAWRWRRAGVCVGGGGSRPAASWAWICVGLSALL